MKKFLFFQSFLLLGFWVSAQNEFKTYDNGLIYNKATMQKLTHIVDSLNLKYKTCDLNKIYYAKQQTIAHYIQLDTGNVAAAKKDLMNNISWNDFIAKYPLAKVEKEKLIVKFKYVDYDERDIIIYSEVNLSQYGGSSIQMDNTKNVEYNKQKKNTWAFENTEKSSYSNERISAFYFPDNFKSIPLPTKYCHQVGYSDCLVDTFTAKFKNTATEGRVELPSDWQKMSFYRKEILLNKMRSTKVIGGCSMDNSPRVHAINMALLSAETAKWEVFLKSHLDIMNDNFSRVSDGSYAFAARKTYIKEIEELNINVLDLLLGISYRVENSSDNHYYGNISRLGRAISESKDLAIFQKEMLSIIADKNLDDYNRVIFYFLFQNCNYYTEDEKAKSLNKKALENAALTLPEYLKKQH